MDLKKLLSITPISEDFKRQILERYDSLTPIQIFDLTELCWSVIDESKRMKIDYLKKKNMLDVALGKKQYDPNDIVEIETKIDYELVESIRKIEKVIEKEYKNSPSSSSNL